MMLLLRLLVTFLSLFNSYSENISVLHAYSPGDIIIGGLFPIHSYNRSTNPNDSQCITYNTQMFLRTQVMIYAIEEINQRTPRLLPNITLGYDIYDTCGDAILAIRATLQLMKNQSDPQSCLLPDSINSFLPEPQTKVVIGEEFSEVSVAVARILALTSVAQISYASTSKLLSSKYKFPTFLRTVPSDEFQTKAIYELVKEFNWKTVAIVGSDDEYGKYGSDQLQYIFNENNICIEFVQILPGDFSESISDTKDLLMDLISDINKTVAEAIILFTKDTNVETILQAVIENDLNRTWIATDTWSTSTEISEMPGIEKIGEVFGFSYMQNEVPGFRDYVRSMFNGKKNDILEYHMSHYPNCSNKSGDKIECNCSMMCSDPFCLTLCVDKDESYSIYLAVQVVAEGLRRLLRCDNQSCERTDFKAFELLEELLNINITVNNTNIHFTDGDPNLGYDVFYWNHSGSHKSVNIETIGTYVPGDNISLPKFPKDLLDRMKNETVTVSNCSKSCEPGYELKQKKMCCSECVPCGDGSFSDGTKCASCGMGQYSNEHSDKCLNKTREFLEWTDPISITLSFFSVLAIIITVVFAAVLKINTGTPVVKAVGGCLCFLELMSLLLNFCLTFTYLGKPTKSSCVGIPLFGFGFSLCMSCILANLLQILVGFKFDLNLSSWIKKLNQPIVVVITISGIQLALSVIWLIKIPPEPTEEQKNTTISYQCSMNEKSQKFFVATISYNAFLGFICFLFAFKGKELPDLYKNAVLITVSMVLFLIIWIIFLPLFLSLEGKYKPASNCAAILISSYSILICHLAPKCYIMVFRKELNNENAITEYIRNHYEKKGLAVIK